MKSLQSQTRYSRLKSQNSIDSKTSKLLGENLRDHDKGTIIIQEKELEAGVGGKILILGNSIADENQDEIG